MQQLSEIESLNSHYNVDHNKTRSVNKRNDNGVLFSKQLLYSTMSKREAIQRRELRVSFLSVKLARTCSLSFRCASRIVRCVFSRRRAFDRARGRRINDLRKVI